ncbi:1-phosphofructokinase family hexose kinase [Actinobacteria bacterium YIM 96077]|uniref:1-phosphofructokinase n=1 Tax=Phytoactinopolyspora halophila TaxID=1981511 RepID=A0A329QAB8_9ACTN|nr:1-phosphofructokinase family hexose kinase [Phytoactinopolyspora halophila]AYY12442.1 1-phosphofructokinase family hexose kinase [Actinobacteria bacterium YIM 96077]RAW09276.1 1-phosphofructokinase [Phytoactinopolyspora halophila]
MIVTVTPNPSADRTIGVDRIHLGRVHHGTSVRVDPGGKGVNVARVLAAHHTKAAAVLPVGGTEGQLLVQVLEEHGVDVVPVPIAAGVRTNVTVVESDGTTTKFNEPGPHLSPDERSALLDAVSATLARSTGAPGWLVGCGSLPGGVGAGFYADLVRLAHARGIRAAIDTSGTALHEAVRAGADLVKPNLFELEEIAGRVLPTLGDVADAARELLATCAGTHPVACAGAHPAALVSLGPHGAVLVREGATPVWAIADAITPRSTVGAGDALLAGYLDTIERVGDSATDLNGGDDDVGVDFPGGRAGGDLADGADARGDLADGRYVEAVRTAVAWGTAAVGLPGSQMPEPSDVAPLRVHVRTDPDRNVPVQE